MPITPTRSVAIVSLGCARNDVDSEELAGRLAANGWRLEADPAAADVAVVNTCGFIEQAKKDSVDTVLQAAELKDDDSTRTQAVVAVGCLAERYGKELAESLPEADAVLGFDSYEDLHSHLAGVLDGERPASHVPRDRRALLPIAPAARPAARGAAARVPESPAGTGARDGGGVETAPGAEVGATVPDGDGAQAAQGGGVDLAAQGGRADLAAQGGRADLAAQGDGADVGPASGPPVVRMRLGDAPWAPLKLASGCDRRCSFCAIPSFRGSFVSRRPDDLLQEARWLADQGVRELFLVSENTTSYGKDLGDADLLATLLPDLVAVEGVERVRASYLQPFELRPRQLEALAATPGVAPYFDLSFQHAAPALLRRMRRFGGTGDFLDLLERVRAIAPSAGARSNVIVGFPGEREADVEELVAFLSAARLDAVGVFGYSDEDGTEAAGFDGKVDDAEIAARVEHVSAVVEELVAQRADERVGESADVLVEDLVDTADDEAAAEVADVLAAAGVTATARDGSGEAWQVLRGRAAHQGPEVDGETLVAVPASAPGGVPGVGALLDARVVAAMGVDLVAVAGTGGAR